jgi:hypothetical protein
MEPPRSALGLNIQHSIKNGFIVQTVPTRPNHFSLE